MSDNRVLYIEANTGVSGDMLVAALLDLGAPEERVRAVLDTLPVDGFEICISRKSRAGIDVCDFDVRLDHEHENNDHNMQYLYGHLSGQAEAQEHGHTHGDGGHSHADGEAHEHDHHHRTMADIRDILERTDMADGARELALRIFGILARAEAQAHGVPEEQVHFHEVGAVDSIVDIVAAAVCVDALAPQRVIVSPLTEGTGTVRTQHGILPVPVPAVVNIVVNEGLILRQGFMQGEYVTPTGAAIAAAVRAYGRNAGEAAGQLPSNYTIEKVGIGGGKREYDPPSMVRVMWLREVGDGSTICRLETDIDDCTGEELGHVMEILYAAGAREVHFTPIFMKKNRPAYELVVITDGELVSRMEGILFKETTTIGIRRQWMERTVLPRESVVVKTKFGELQAKKVTLPDGEVRVFPEYESAKKLASENGVSIREIYSDI